MSAGTSGPAWRASMNCALASGGHNDAHWVRLDITQPAEVNAAMQGIETVIHLAVASGHEGDYEDDTFNQLRFDVNVRGTWNILEAARRAGVRRVVHTSSIMVVWDYLPPQWVPGDASLRPVGTCALTKQMAEMLCRVRPMAGDGRHEHFKSTSVVPDRLSGGMLSDRAVYFNTQTYLAATTLKPW